MTEPRKPTDDTVKKGPTDPILSASALGFAMAAQAVEFWFGVASGVARASQDMLERNKTAPTFAPDVKSAAEAVKAAARTAAAEVERTTRDVVEVAAKLATPVVAPKPKPAPEAKAEPKVASVETNISAKPATAKVETKPVPSEAKPVAPAAPVVEIAEAVAPAAMTPVESTKPVPKVAVTPAVASPKPEAKPAKAVAKPKAAKASKPVQAAPAPAASTPATQAITHPAAPSIMPEDFRAPKTIAKPDQPDDLKLLPGVGPKLEQVLNSLGVWTYAQVSAWEPEEIAYVEDLTGLDGRIAADGWLAQAVELHDKAARAAGDK